MASHQEPAPKKSPHDKYPHQVTVRIARGGFGIKLMEMHIFCTQRAMRYHTHAERRDIGDIVRFTFAEPAHAKTFASAFAGERMPLAESEPEIESNTQNPASNLSRAAPRRG